MGEIFKILIVALISVVARLLCIEEFIIGTILLASLPIYFFERKIIELIPLIICSIFFMLAIDSGSVLAIFIWGLSVLLYRVVFGLKLVRSNLWIFSLVVLLGVSLFNNGVIQIPALLSLLLFPVNMSFRLNEKYKSTKLHYIFGLLIIVISAHLLLSDKEDKVAYFEKGVWANSDKEYLLNDLTNETSYSYSEFVKFIKADKIYKTNEIAKYSTIWLVTPTEPFTKVELTSLNKWVLKGGKLIVVSDHTDLFGHARCVNQVVNMFNMRTNYSCLFNVENREIFRTSDFNYANIKTGAPVFGSFSWPLLNSYLWEEDAYYANDNFFGPLAPSGEDNYKRHSLTVKKMVGLGEVTLLGDSTFFSNFSVYQPWNFEFIQKISMRSWFAIIAMFFPFLLVFILYSKSVGLNTPILIVFLSISFIGSLLNNKVNALSLDYGKDPQLWTGNYKFIMENECPFSSISTAFSISSFSGRNPKWISNYKDIKDSLDVIWVDSLPPPVSSWRWVKTEDDHSLFQESKSHPFYPLFSTLHHKVFMPLIVDRTSFDTLSVRGVFNDMVMNDWWYNSGVSPHRLIRFQEWINWLKKSEITEIPNFNKNEFSKDFYSAYLKIDKKPGVVKLQLMKPISDSGYVYLGAGLSAVVVKNNGVKSLLSVSPFNEKWQSEKIWSITFQ